jgi:hypothetical protein
MTGLEELGKQHKILKPWTEIGLRWATKYYIQMDDTNVYVITMCTFIVRYILLLGRQPKPIVLNPAIHLSWIEGQWGRQYIEDSKDMILSLISTIYHYIPPFSHLSRRCASTVPRNRRHLQPLYPIALSNLLHPLEVNSLQRSSKSTVLYTKRKLRPKSSL